MATLGDYLVSTRRLLKDSTAAYWTDNDLTEFINKAMRQRDRDTGMNRQFVPYPLTQGKSSYDASAVHPRVLDIFGIYYYNGNFRYALSEVSFTDLQAIIAPYRTFTQWPVAFAKHGPLGIVIGPTPSQTFEGEWDCITYSQGLSSPENADPLPYPWTDPVPFLAASFAKIEMQQVDQAQQFEEQYTRRLTEIVNSTRSRMLANPYYGRRLGSRW
jgi:hypothetical protein